MNEITTNTHNWQPKRWITAILSFLFAPIGMLYLGRKGWNQWGQSKLILNQCSQLKLIFENQWIRGDELTWFDNSKWSLYYLPSQKNHFIVCPDKKMLAPIN